MNAEDKVRAERIKEASPEIIRKYAGRSNLKAAFQCVNTLVPYFALYYLAMESLATSYWLSAIYILLLSLFTVRIFMLMHDAGHLSLFDSKLLNTISGFFTGVFVGMPQYVWSQHHNYHHATNGNWEKYRGPLNILSVSEYERLSTAGQKRYRNSRNILLAPFGAFMYFIFNPRFNWLLGSIKFFFAVLSAKLRNVGTPLATLIAKQESRYWKTGREYLHMTLNNIVLITIWVAASRYFGAVEFFTVFTISLVLAGAAGIIIFTIQHNFEGSYASDDQHWDYHLSALKGSSFLTFPWFINWFGADIAYHHIHHLSARIPNYNLAACHREYAGLFEEVKRIKLSDIAESFKYILWDDRGMRIISIEQYEQMKGAVPAAA